jgi:PBSX family phage terminase large subunit
MRVAATIPEKFSALLDANVRKIVEVSGRSSGKSTTNETVAAGLMLRHRSNNIWYCRAEKGDVRPTIYNSFLSTLQFMGIDHLFRTSLSPMEITCLVTGAKCYFGGINGKVANDLNTTKGFTPQDKSLAMFILDEANEAKSSLHVRAAETTANKFLKADGKIIYAYNPPPVRTHWAHRYFGDEIKNGATRIYTTYEDIYQLLKPATIQEIEEMKANNPRQFAYWYMGQMVSLEGLVLYTFKRDRNLFPLENFRRMAANGYHPLYVIYGVDSGIVKDATAVCAWGVMPDGILLKLGTFYLNPKDEGEPIPNSMQVRSMKQWYDEFYALMRMHGVMMPGAYNECWVFDSAVVTQDLMFEWQNHTGFYCRAVENKNIERDIKRLQNGYFRGIFRVLDIPMNEPSLRETETFCYDENNEIPDGQDDHTIDADKYATAHYYYNYMTMSG